MKNLNEEVTKFFDESNHPFRKEIEELRHVILDAIDGLTENIKWNGPNYCCNGQDRITMKIHPPKQIQLIFHRGAKKQEPLAKKLIPNTSKMLLWKENDRAIITIRDYNQLKAIKSELFKIVAEWINATG